VVEEFGEVLRGQVLACQFHPGAAFQGRPGVPGALVGTAADVAAEEARPGREAGGGQGEQGGGDAGVGRGQAGGSGGAGEEGGREAQGDMGLGSELGPAVGESLLVRRLVP
jgi:hypothetical protein